MSSAGSGFDPLSLMMMSSGNPEDYQNLLAIQRRQAMAQQLLEQGSQQTGPRAVGNFIVNSPWEGAANAAKQMLGAYMYKKSAQDMAGLYANALRGGSGQPQAATAPADPSTMGKEGAQQPPVALSQGSQSAQADQGAPGGGSPLDLMFPDIPGQAPIPRMQKLMMLQNPSMQAEYIKARFAAGSPTDQMKQVASALPGGFNDPQFLPTMIAFNQKALQTNVSAGGGIVGPGNQMAFAMPTRQGFTPTQDPATGQVGLTLPANSQQAMQSAAVATGLGKAQTTPAIGYDANNQPVPTNQAQMLGYGQPQQPPMGQAAPAAASAFSEMGAQSLVKALFPGSVITSGQRSPLHNQQVGGVPNSMHLGGNAVDFVLPHGRSFADVQNAFAQAGIPATELINEGNHVHWGWGTKGQGSPTAQPSRPLIPELPPGQAQYAQSQAKDAADRHDMTVQMASESPMRINVLDNIIGLSGNGVATGPSQEWQNEVLGYVANTPWLSKVMSGTKNSVAQFQELQKFTYQNALRSWQIAGGTGTDAQMASFSHANPNDTLFPQALQAIAKWGKAAELAVQGKANAQDQFLGQVGQTPQNQIQFENRWRNAFDPKVFQYGLMSPQEKHAYAMSQSPQAAKAFLAKQQQLKQMGALQ